MAEVREPYVGPRPFTIEDERLFFGRDREASDLRSLIIAHPVVLLYAQSGAGKTSLLNAKIIPLLNEHGAKLLGMARVSGKAPPQAKSIRNIYVFNALLCLAEKAPNIKELALMTFDEYLRGQAQPPRHDGISSLRIIIFDQFEEIFTTFPERWQDRAALFDEIGAALEEDRLLRVVFALREEFLGSMDPYCGSLPERLRTRFRLERLREEPALLAVNGPLQGTGRKFTPEAALKLVRNLLKAQFSSAPNQTNASGEFVEPVHLQIVCQTIWHALPPTAEVIGLQYIERSGDVDQALFAYYERCIAEVKSEFNISEDTLRRWFEQELITPSNTRGIIFQDANNTGRISNDIVRRLEQLYLIRPEIRGGAIWYELAHDRFVAPIVLSNEKWRRTNARWPRIWKVFVNVFDLVLGIEPTLGMPKRPK